LPVCHLRLSRLQLHLPYDICLPLPPLLQNYNHLPLPPPPLLPHPLYVLHREGLYADTL